MRYAFDITIAAVVIVLGIIFCTMMLKWIWDTRPINPRYKRVGEIND